MKLMGRSSGFIAMHASLASGQVDVCLIPEVNILDLISVLQFLLTPSVLLLITRVIHLLTCCVVKLNGI